MGVLVCSCRVLVEGVAIADDGISSDGSNEYVDSKPGNDIVANVC